MIFAISVTLFFIVIRFTVTLFNFISNPKLTRVNKAYTHLVSILIPARNEEDNILKLLHSIRLQDYQHYEVIIYDDDSSDNTFYICEAFSAAHHHFRVIRGGKLPPGWLGKNNACHQLAKQAKGKYFLFLDADVVISKSLINSAVHRMSLYKLALLSIFPNQVMQTIGEKTTVPLLHYLFMNLLPVRLVRLSKSTAFAAACGQFMLFDAAIYRQNQWHQLVKEEAVESVEIMKILKAASYAGEVLLANLMVSCRMFKDYRSAINGFSRIFPASFSYSIPVILIYILLTIGGPLVVITTLNLNLIVYMAGLIMLTRIMISLSAGQNAFYNIFFHPLQMLNMTIIAFLSIQKQLTKTLVWKGRRLQ